MTYARWQNVGLEKKGGNFIIQHPWTNNINTGTTMSKSDPLRQENVQSIDEEIVTLHISVCRLKTP